MKTRLISRTVRIDGLRTSLRLEQASWDVLGDICENEGLTIHDLISLVDHQKYGGSRTSAVRIFIVTYLRKLATERGSLRKGTILSILPELGAHH